MKKYDVFWRVRPSEICPGDRDLVMQADIPSGPVYVIVTLLPGQAITTKMLDLMRKDIIELAAERGTTPAELSFKGNQI